MKVEPLKGDCDGRETDAGIDAVYEVSSRESGEKRTLLGFAARHKGAPFQAVCDDIPESALVQVRRLLNERDGLDQDDERECQSPQSIAAEADDE